MSHTFLNLLDSGDYQTYNRSVARTLESVNGAIMLSELVNRYLYHESEEELSTFSDLEGEWFYYTIAACEERTVLSRKEQDSAISVLKKEGLVETAQKSLPAKRYFRLRLKDIEAFVYRLKKLTRKSKRDKLDCPKGTNRTDQKGQTLSIKNTSKNSTKEHHLPPVCSGGGELTLEENPITETIVSLGLDVAEARQLVAGHVDDPERLSNAVASCAEYAQGHDVGDMRALLCSAIQTRKRPKIRQQAAFKQPSAANESPPAVDRTFIPKWMKEKMESMKKQAGAVNMTPADTQNPAPRSLYPTS